MKDNIKILIKIKKHINKVFEFTENIDYDNFIKDIKTVDACIFNIGQIGEQVKKFPQVFMKKYSNIKWIGIQGLRNKIYHDYDGIDFEIIWKIITETLPEFIISLNEIIEKEGFYER